MVKRSRYVSEAKVSDWLLLAVQLHQNFLGFQLFLEVHFDDREPDE